jgi:hypothetical protein
MRNPLLSDRCREHRAKPVPPKSDGLMADVDPDMALEGLASLEPAAADPAEVARAIARVVDTPFGKRPFRVHIDQSQDGAEVVNAVADRKRREMYRNIDLEVLLSPRGLSSVDRASSASAY